MEPGIHILQISDLPVGSQGKAGGITCNYNFSYWETFYLPKEHVCVFVCVCVCVCVKASKIYSLSNFPIYDTVLLTIVTVLNIRSTEFIHLIKEICTI